MITNTIRLVKGYNKVYVHAKSKWLIENNVQRSLIDDHARMNVSDDTLIH